MAVEGGGGGGSSNMVRAGGAVVEVVAKDNTAAGLASVKKSVEKTAAEVKQAGPGGVAAAGQLNTESVRAQELARRGAQLTLQSRTAAEKYKDTQKELNALLTAGAITQTVFARATKKAADEMRAARAAAGGTEGGGTAAKLSAALGKFGLGKAGIGGGEIAGAAGVGLVGGAILASGAALVQAGSAAGAASIEDLAPIRARELRAQNKAIELDRMRADQAGPEARQELLAKLTADRDRAQAEVKVNIDRMRKSVGGQTVFDVRSLPGGIGEGWTAKIDQLKAVFEQFGQGVEELAHEVKKQAVTVKGSIRAYRSATRNLGENPERQALYAEMDAGGLTLAQYKEKFKAVLEREKELGFNATFEFNRGLRLSTRTAGLAPEAAGIVNLKETLKQQYNQDPEQIDRYFRTMGTRTDAAASIEKRRVLGHQTVSTDFFRQRRDQAEMDKLAGPLRDQAFSGTLGQTGGYDYGGGGQWQQELKSDLNKQIELARSLLLEAQAHRRVDEQAAKDVGQMKDALTFGG